ncbi:hypothetical protein EDF32_2770 [Cellulomonas sp. PhB143]|nr:hypothetical protein EDF32_2770 [Cellulomonas sp. PhB143]
MTRTVTTRPTTRLTRVRGTAAVLAAGALLLTGCGTSGEDDGTTAGPAAASRTATPTPTPTPVALLTCDDLVDSSAVATTLTFADGKAPKVVEALQPDLQMDPYLITEAGGLGCSYRNGPEPTQPDYVEDGAAYVGVEVLPGAGDYFVEDAGDTDEPVDPSVDVAGVQSVSTCGPLGCLVAGVVGDSWVRVWMHTSGWEQDFSPYEGMPDREKTVLGGLQAIASRAYGALAEAPAEAYAWRARGEATPVTCKDLSAAVGKKAETWGYGKPLDKDAPAGPEDAKSFDQVLWMLMDGTTCRWKDGYDEDFVSVVPGAASLVERLATSPDEDVLYRPTTISGADQAIRYCRQDYCETFFSAGGDAYQTSSKSLAKKLAATAS